MNVTLRQIEGFLAAADALSFSTAAKAMNITQSAFSQLIREFESALETRLFDRTTRTVVLTRAGEALVAKLRIGVGAIEDACQTARSLKQLETGKVSLATLPSLAGGLVTRAMGELRRLHPGITVALHETDNADVLTMVLRGDVEFAVCVKTPTSDDLTFDSLYLEELVLVVPRGHPLTAKRSHKWSVLKSQSLIMPTMHTTTQRDILDALRANHVELKPAFEVAGIMTSVSMVRSGLGVTVMPHTALIDMNLQGVVTCRLASPTVYRKISICRRKDRTLGPAAQRIVQLLQTRSDRVQELTT